MLINIKSIKAIFCYFKINFSGPLTCAKSLILLKSAFAILGVPRLLLAISTAAFSSIFTLRIPADLFTIPVRTS